MNSTIKSYTSMITDEERVAQQQLENHKSILKQSGLQEKARGAEFNGSQDFYNTASTLCQSRNGNFNIESSSILQRNLDQQYQKTLNSFNIQMTTFIQDIEKKLVQDVDLILAHIDELQFFKITKDEEIGREAEKKYGIMPPLYKVEIPFKKQELQQHISTKPNRPQTKKRGTALFFILVIDVKVNRKQPATKIKMKQEKMSFSKSSKQYMKKQRPPQSKKKAQAQIKFESDDSNDDLMNIEYSILNNQD
ncbi:UNKNOWN [Stylonychia lemnae]|uniref:Uncharacterized protein n=1 Tax=Stylonychia lemnae TaxID=5949 RepID=A0A077ZQS5_STYLE|nr:UNKNOWN [Stylonychia lemnae]|eukprot:CDW71735.1 UNKNOWN [Stylonychia lemnae]